ncbi:hypothetical protein ISF_09625 [Cordyceps fumosorosea ARSEF 2679]|uniref:Uncharacterized protein n=1 Tax=Cordyceps fumosorosea (strain ARSEF 2679) TaxID=1081104 RepID=A0A162JIB2_CORFA|nr:hypothetical protein ISF_09625 [Cordyceps fumosorosea ARSEF 2679]OAA44738.1 hypothetical protein ISF_09625 [Cordyceps fumosorosea ARSEF 2679]
MSVSRGTTRLLPIFIDDTRGCTSKDSGEEGRDAQKYCASDCGTVKEAGANRREAGFQCYVGQGATQQDDTENHFQNSHNDDANQAGSYASHEACEHANEEGREQDMIKKALGGLIPTKEHQF